MIQIRKGTEQNLWVVIDYSQENVRKIRQLTRQWNPERKHWIVPYSQAAIQSLYELFHDEKVIIDEYLSKEIAQMQLELDDSTEIKKPKIEIEPYTREINMLLSSAQKVLKLKGYK